MAAEIPDAPAKPQEPPASIRTGPDLLSVVLHLDRTNLYLALGTLEAAKDYAKAYYAQRAEEEEKTRIVKPGLIVPGRA